MYPVFAKSLFMPARKLFPSAGITRFQSATIAAVNEPSKGSPNKSDLQKNNAFRCSMERNLGKSKYRQITTLLSTGSKTGWLSRIREQLSLLLSGQAWSL